MSAGGRILIIDDDPDFLAAYREFLAAEGYAVEVTISRSQGGYA